MLLKFWSWISYLGVKTEYSNSEKRNIIVTNRIIFILFILVFPFAIISSLSYSMESLSRNIVVGYTIALLITLIFNRAGLSRFCRIFLSYFLPIFTLYASIQFKILNPGDAQDYQFYAARIIILIFAVMPIVYFDLKDRVEMFISLLGGFLPLALFDPIHNYLGIGYYDLGFEGDRYSFINVVIILTYFLFFGTMIFLKRLIEFYETKSTTLISTLRKKNDSLHELNTELHASKKELEEQKEELRSQKEELTTNQEKLMELNAIIDDQKEKLQVINKDLQSDLEIKNDHLIQANNELVRNNNELRQFSYTISHNLRGPLASLMGLTELLSEKKIDKETESIIGFITDSVKKLDETIKDLNKVLDIRNSVNQVRENVMVDEEIDKVLLALKQELDDSGVRMDLSIETRQVYSVRAIINSILYNLISNAIKFRSREREPVIWVSTHTEGDQLVLKVRDNGLGMDLEFYQKDLFKMYKRFHLHTEGRGMGLYLTNLQVEILDGTVDVDSKSNKGTEFTIILPLEINKVLIDNVFVRVEYDLILNTSMVIWKGEVDNQQFKDNLNNVVDLLSHHRINSWISDIRERGEIDKDALQWMFKNIFPKAITNGVSNILIVGNQDQGLENLKKAFEEKAENVDLKILFFTDMESARDYLKMESGEAIL